ncbi:MAG: DUF4124 domain-containing protein [Pseudomonadota bacterium]
MTTLKTWQLVAAGALLALTSVAHAQYVWIDAKGNKQMSDQGPPSDVPASKILKAPGRAKLALGVTGDAAAEESASAAPAAPKTVADREADFRKRHKEKTEADAKAASMAANQAQRQVACDAARIRNTELASGKRLRGADNGVLDDAGRAAQQASTNQTLAECAN